MAADQRKKGFNASSSLVACTSRDQYRVKRKRLEEPLHNNLKMRPTISLEWDSKKKGVVSRRDQIGISQRHMRQVVNLVPNGHKVLADVLSVPQEIFQLENLSEILSFEVWQSHLSENERSFLSRFLPKETHPDTVVRDLFDGNNFHFGNPFLNWGTSLCSGELHPDNVLHKEQSLKACKKAYHLNLQNYHYDMIDNLETWKEKWVSCNDPEADIVPKMWRKHARKGLLPPETRFYTEENYVATPESANSEKVESHNRKRLLNKKSESSSSGLKVVSVPNQGEKVHKRNIQSEDGAKYMSYIKVSKEQHDRVKSSMKHTGNSIRPRSLNNVLGSIDALNVQPFERFEEEERSNIHKYWLKLANRDIPGYFAAWKSRQLQRQQVTWSLGEEIKVKLEHLEVNEDKEEECHSQNNVMEPSSENNCLEVLPVEDVNKEQQPNSLLEEDQMDEDTEAIQTTTDLEDVNGKKDDYVFEEQKHDDTDATGEEDDEVREHVQEDCNEKQHNASSLNDSATMVSDMIEPPTNFIFLKVEQDQQQIPPLCPVSNNPQVINNSVEMQQSHCSSASAKTEGEDASPPIVSEYHHSPGNVDISVSQGRQGKDVWAGSDEVRHGSYYQSPTQEFSQSGHPQLIQQQEPVQNQMLDLESNRNKNHVLHRESHDMSFFDPYPNTTTQDRNELLQSLIKEARNDLPYLRQSEKMQLQPGHDAVMEEMGGQFAIPRHHHQSLALDIMSQKRLNDVLYLQQQQSSIQDNSLFSIPSSISQEQQFGMSTPLSLPQLNQNNWFTVQNNTSGSGGGREVWTPSFEGGVGGSSNNDNLDQSLYSVLSECNELRSAAAAAGTSSYDSMSSSEQYIQTHAGLGLRGNNYNGRIGVGIPIPSSSITATTNYNMLQQLAPNHGNHPLNYLSGHEPAAVVATGGLSMLSNNNISLGGGPWGLSLPHPPQNPPGRRQHDSSMTATKPPFLRSSWNQ